MDLNYKVWGSGPPLVILHGLFGSLDNWSSIAKVLGASYTVYALDLRNHGRSFPHPEFNYEVMSEDVVRWSQQNQLSDYILLGHSMGGNIALRYASAHPQKVTRLMLVDAAGILHRLSYTQFLTHFGIDVLPQFYPEQKQDMAFVAEQLLGELAASHSLLEWGEKAILETPQLRQSILGANPNTIAAYAMIMTDYSELIDKIKVPTLILWGKQDKVVPVRTAKILATSLPNAGLVLFDQTGHSPMRERPKRFAHWLKRFVQSSEQQYQSIIDKTHYKIELEPSRSQQDLNCHNEHGKHYVGDYRKIEIKNCHDIVLDSIRAEQIVIQDSNVVLNNCYLKSNKTALIVERSQLEMNGCDVTGSPALAFYHAKLDIAATTLRSDGPAAIQHHLSPPTKTRSSSHYPQSEIFYRSFVLFSVSRHYSGAGLQLLHGPQRFVPRSVK